MPLPFCPSDCALLSKRSKPGESATCVTCTDELSQGHTKTDMQANGSHSSNLWDLADTYMTMQAHLSGEGQLGAVLVNDPPKL